MVDPITKPELIEDMLIYLEDTNMRDYIMFALTFFCSLRISDVLSLKVKDIVNGRDEIKKYLKIKEQKTKKINEILISDKKLRENLKEFTAGKESWEYLIKSTHGENKPLSRQQAYNIIKKAGEKIGLSRLGTHTGRKSSGRMVYERTNGDIYAVMDLLNQSNIRSARSYIGVDKAYKDKLRNLVRI